MWLFLNNCPTSFPTRDRKLPLAPSEPPQRPVQRIQRCGRSCCFRGRNSTAGTGRSFVIDTSVLLSDPRALLRFAEHEVIVPIVVITELEGKRHDPELGYFARKALRLLDDLRVKHGGLDRPIPLGDDGGTLMVELNHISAEVLPAGFPRRRTTTAGSSPSPRTSPTRAGTSPWCPRTCRCASRPRPWGCRPTNTATSWSRTPAGPASPKWTPARRRSPPSTATSRSSSRRPRRCRPTPAWCCSRAAAPPWAGWAPTSRSGWSRGTATSSDCTAAPPNSGSRSTC